MSENYHYNANKMSRDELERAFIRERMTNEQSLQASRVWFENEKKDRAVIAELRAEVERLKGELTQLREDRRLNVELIRELEEMASEYAKHHGHAWDGTGYYRTLCKRVKEATDASGVLGRAT